MELEIQTPSKINIEPESPNLASQLSRKPLCRHQIEKRLIPVLKKTKTFVPEIKDKIFISNESELQSK
jgi:hypothetical protein